MDISNVYFAVREFTVQQKQERPVVAARIITAAWKDRVTSHVTRRVSHLIFLSLNP